MTLDKRPIFTVGMVWSDLVKRLPRDYPRYRRPLPSIQQFSGLGTFLSDEQVAALRQQQQAQATFFPFRSYQPPTPSSMGGWFDIIGIK